MLGCITDCCRTQVPVVGSVAGIPGSVVGKGKVGRPSWGAAQTRHKSLEDTKRPRLVFILAFELQRG